MGEQSQPSSLPYNGPFQHQCVPGGWILPSGASTLLKSSSYPGPAQKLTLIPERRDNVLTEPAHTDPWTSKSLARSSHQNPQGLVKVQWPKSHSTTQGFVFDNPRSSEASPLFVYCTSVAVDLGRFVFQGILQGIPAMQWAWALLPCIVSNFGTCGYTWINY